MNRQQLAHILRAACRVVGTSEVLVLGSQSRERAEGIAEDQKPVRLERIHGFLDLYDHGAGRPGPTNL